MNTKHTPGPWRHDLPIAVDLIKKSQPIDGCTIFIAHGPSVGGEICTLRHDPEDGLDLVNDPQQLANAKLIAAAPELLEAIEGLLKEFVTPSAFPELAEHPEQFQRMADAEIFARAAIVKATE